MEVWVALCAAQCTTWTSELHRQTAAQPGRSEQSANGSKGSADKEVQGEEGPHAEAHTASGQRGQQQSVQPYAAGAGHKQSASQSRMAVGDW